jgi:pyruvate dehydrogenase E1 component beta subunit
MVVVALEAAEMLADEGISLEVIDLRTLVPLDTATIVRSVQKTAHAIVIHEAPRTAGVGAEIVAQINERALYSLEAPVARVTGYDIIPPAGMEDSYLPNATRVMQAVHAVLDEQTP